MSTSNEIVHEAEVQRQFVRLQVPATIIIGQHSEPAHDWSVNGFSVDITADAPAVATRQTGKLTFDFDDFQFDVPFEAEVRHATEIEKNGRKYTRVGCQFTNMATRQRDLLRYVSSAYLQGELVTTGDILGMVKRDNSATPRKAAQAKVEDMSRWERLTNVARTPLTWLVLFAIVTFSLTVTVNAFYRSTYVSELSTAEVLIDTPTARAPVAGVITFLAGQPGDIIPAGQPLMGVRRASGEEVFVDSACDCEILTSERREREYVDSGEVVMRLVQPGSRTFVRLYVSKSNAPWIFENNPDWMVARVLGSDTDFELSIGNSFFDASRDMVVLDMLPTSEIPYELAGRPATVTLEAGRFTLIGRIRAWFRG